MPDDILPEPLPSGALVPPPRNPPTALATAAPMPPSESAAQPLAQLQRVVESVLDTLDLVGDRIAGVIGMR